MELTKARRSDTIYVLIMNDIIPYSIEFCLCHGVFMRVQFDEEVKSMYEDDIILEMMRIGRHRIKGIEDVWKIYIYWRLRWNQVVYRSSDELDSILPESIRKTFVSNFPRGVADYIKRPTRGEGRAGS